MLIVDSHCHLNFPDFQEDIDEVIARAEDEHVGVMQTICTKMSEFDDIHAISQRYPHVYCSVGVHPHEADKTPTVTVDELVAKAALPKVIGLGETGLDYFYEHSPRAEQKASFLNHIEASRQTGLPIIVHTRDADDDTVDMLQSEMHKGTFTGLIHCFSSSLALAEACIELGMYISISGIVTFKKAEALRDAVKALPLERLLVETDAPYLAPMPMRGKRNEPAYTSYTNRFLAELKGVSEVECARITTDNFFTLFGRAERPAH